MDSVNQSCEENISGEKLGALTGENRTSKAEAVSGRKTMLGTFCLALSSAWSVVVVMCNATVV